MPTVRVEDPDDPRLDIYRDLPSTKLEKKSGRFVAEGKLLAQRLLDSGWPIESLLIEEQRLAELDRPVPEELLVYVVPRGTAQRIVGVQFHRGIVACGIRPPNASPYALPLSTQSRWVVPVCFGVQDPENLGGILRSAAAFGAPGALLGPECADPLSRRVLRVSMGAPFHLPIAHVEQPEKDLAALRNEFGATTVATVLDENAEALPDVRAPERVFLLLGNEGHGLDPFWQRWADRRWTIPMSPSTDSLNVSVACALFLYHLTRVVPAQEPATSLSS